MKSHGWKPSLTDKTKCGIIHPNTKHTCNRTFMDHTGMAECEVCGAKAECELIDNNILVCAKCESDNKLTDAQLLMKDTIDITAINQENIIIKPLQVDMSLSAQQARIDEHNNGWKRRQLGEAHELLNRTIEEARQIDASIQIPTDIFNAGTVSINELKSIIDKDESILNKDWELAKQVETRFKHYKEVLFRNDNARSVINAEMRASHSYLTELAKRLTEQERDALQLKDINYRPSEKGPIKVPLSNVGKAAKKSKLDMDEVKKYCRILADENIPVLIETMAGFCIAMNKTPEQAHNELRRTIKEAKSQTS